MGHRAIARLLHRALGERFYSELYSCDPSRQLNELSHVRKKWELVERVDSSEGDIRIMGAASLRGMDSIVD